MTNNNCDIEDEGMVKCGVMQVGTSPSVLSGKPCQIVDENGEAKLECEAPVSDFAKVAKSLSIP